MRDPGCRSRKGFNLIELAIVLAVVGTVIGGIYLAASSVNESNKLSQARSQFYTLTDNLRKYYAFQPKMNGDPNPATLAAKGVIPSDMPLAGGVIQGAFGPVVITDNESHGFTPGSINIGMQGFSKAACTKFFTAVVGNDQDFAAMNACGSNVNGVAVAHNVTSAANLCNQVKNTIDICIYLR